MQFGPRLRSLRDSLNGKTRSVVQTTCIRYDNIVGIVNIISFAYNVYMDNKETKPLNMNIDTALLERIDKYRFKRMFPSRSEAIESLLEAGLKLNPDRPDRQRHTALRRRDETRRGRAARKGKKSPAETKSRRA